MRIHILTSNVFLRMGIIALAAKNDFIINAIYPDDEHYTSKINFNDLVIFHVDRHTPLLIKKLDDLHRRVKMILISPNNLRLDTICDANDTVDESASLTHLLASILKIANKPVCYQKKHVYLSVREQRVLLDTLNGINACVIAKRLGVSIKTIYAHKLNAYRKLGAKNIHEILPLKKLISWRYSPPERKSDNFRAENSHNLISWRSIN